MKDSVKITTSDKFKLSASLFEPEAPNGYVVVLNSATGVKQRYYSEFASFLKDQGYIVYTYDYRGIGGSRPKSLRGFSASMHEWGQLDFHAVLQHVYDTHPKFKVVVIGHSVGGQLIGVTPLAKKIYAVVMVAAQTPYWKNYPGFKLKLKLYWFWFLLLPSVTKLFGYFPAKKIGLFEDLPKHVALQWARWAKTPSYMFEEFPDAQRSFEALTTKSLMISFSDDEFAPPNAVLDLIRWYPNMLWQHSEIRPQELGLTNLGHFAFFKPRFKETLWNKALLWLQDQKVNEANV
jgi:predicted alpha/beta hydrolase